MKRSGSVTLGLLVALAGCGGGGGDVAGSSGAGGSMSQTPNLEAAPAPQEPFNIQPLTLTTNLDGDSYTATYSQTPNSGTTMFDGQAAHSSTISLTIKKNGSAFATVVSTAYYLESPYEPLGLAGTVGGTAYTLIFTSTNPYPSMLTVGSSGTLGTGTYYLSGTNNVVGSLTETFSVTANSSSSLLLTTHGSGTFGGLLVDETVTYIVDSSGALALDSVQLTVDAVQLGFTASPWDY